MGEVGVALRILATACIDAPQRRSLKAGHAPIEVEDSFTAFIRRMRCPLKLGKSGPNGEEFRAFKDQLTRLAVATVRLALSTEVRSFQVNSHY